MEEPYIDTPKWKKPVWKGYIVYDSNYITLWKMKNYGDSKKISGCKEVGEGEKDE